MRSSQIVNVTVAHQMFITIWRQAMKQKSKKHWKKEWQRRKGHDKVWSEAEVTATVKTESTLKFCGLFKILIVPVSIDVPNCWILWVITPQENHCKVKVWKAFYVQQWEQIFWKDKMGQEKGTKFETAGREKKFSTKDQLWFCSISKETLPM